jgi:uncharacterized membrane protein YdbT with pleckstrin-like domain
MRYAGFVHCFRMSSHLQEAFRVRARILNFMDSYLAPGETLQVRTGPHWIVYLRSIVSAVMILIVGAALTYEAMNTTAAHATIYAALAVAAVGIAIAILASATLQRRTQQILVTEYRVLEASGVLHRKTNEMRIAAIRTVTIDQSIFGRLLNYGTITLQTGNEDPMVLSNIAFPQELHQALQDHLPHESNVAVRA